MFHEKKLVLVVHVSLSAHIYLVLIPALIPEFFCLVPDKGILIPDLFCLVPDKVILIPDLFCLVPDKLVLMPEYLCLVPDRISPGT